MYDKHHYKLWLHLGSMPVDGSSSRVSSRLAIIAMSMHNCKVSSVRFEEIDCTIVLLPFVWFLQTEHGTSCPRVLRCQRVEENVGRVFRVVVIECRGERQT